MKKVAKLLSVIMILSVLVGASVTWERDSVEEGEIIEVDFPYEVAEENISVPDGFEYLGYESGAHKFKALKDMENVSGSLFYNEKEMEQELDGGETNDNGEVGTEESGIADWESYQIGKQLWKNGHEFIFSIRVQADKFNREDSITIIDTANKEMTYRTEPYVVGYYIESESIGTPDEIDAKIDYKETGFEIVFNPTDHDIYEVNYIINRLDDLSNGYKALQKGLKVVSGGEILGEIGSEETPEEPVEETPEEPVEETPENPVEETPEEPEIPEEDEIEDVEPEKPDMPIIEENPEDPKEDEIEDVEPEKPEAPIIEEEPENSEEDKIEDKEPNKPELPVVEETPEEEPEEEIEDEVEDIESERKKPSVKEATKENKVEKLPATGSKSHVGTYILGLSMILLGLVLRRKNK